MHQSPDRGLVSPLSSLFRSFDKERHWNVIQSVTMEVINHYERVVMDELMLPGDLTESPSCVVHYLVRNAAAKGTRLDTKDVVANAFSFIFAAYANAFAVLGWALWHATTEPGLANALRQSLKGRTLDRRGLEGWDMGRQVANECIRMHIASLFMRKVVAPGGYTLRTGHIVPEGDIMAVQAFHVLRHPALHKQPLRFDPSRFSKGNDEREKESSLWIGFGTGKHPCPGQRFGTLEILVLLAMVLQTFDLEPLSLEVQMSEVQASTVGRPTGPAQVAYRRRQ